MSVRKSNEADSKIQLPITAMLDMTFQLLFFFVINFHPADLEGQMDMMLPSQDVKAAKDQKEVDKKAAPEKEPVPEFPADLTVRVICRGGEDSDGSISAVAVRTIEGKEDQVRDLEGLKGYLKEKRETLTNKEGIKVMGDSRLKIKHLMKVMDVCRTAGFKDVSFITPEGGT